jgi:Na+/melibiose symporter-like transporter
MNLIYLKYFLFSLITHAIVFIALGILIQLFHGGHDYLGAIGTGIAIAFVFSGFNLFYYNRGLAALGVNHKRQEDLQKLLVIEKISKRSLDEITERLNKFKSSQNWKIEKIKDGIQLKNNGFSGLKPSLIKIMKLTETDNIYSYRIKAIQSIAYDLATYYHSIKAMKYIEKHV